MARGRSGGGINLANYNSGPRKAMTAMKKTYGSGWAHVYYGLANKRAGRGLRGAGRGHRAANVAYAKGSHWKGTMTGNGNVRRHGMRRGATGGSIRRSTKPARLVNINRLRQNSMSRVTRPGRSQVTVL